MTDKLSIKTYSDAKENVIREKMYEHFLESPIPGNQVLSNLQMFINSKTLSRILFFNHMYQLFLNTHGVIMEFGTRWGSNLCELAALRGIYEPFNRHRKIIGFDTFAGFPRILKEDGKSDMMKTGNLTLPKDYSNYLSQLMKLHESDNPLDHLTKFEICEGNAVETLPTYLDRHPETIVAFAYFDFDLFEPTKICLEKIKSRLVKGSVIAFDELCDTDSPGETLALMEVFGLPNVELRRFPITSRVSYFVV